jgi:hypothetical protein
VALSFFTIFASGGKEAVAIEDSIDDQAIYGIARAAEARGDNATARQRYQEFLQIWKDADRIVQKSRPQKNFWRKCRQPPPDKPRPGEQCCGRCGRLRPWIPSNPEVINLFFELVPVKR